MRSVFSNSRLTSPLITSELYHQGNFYEAFHSDLKRARNRVIIESPFLTMRRVDALAPRLQALVKKRCYGNREH